VSGHCQENQEQGYRRGTIAIWTEKSTNKSQVMPIMREEEKEQRGAVKSEKYKWARGRKRSLLKFISVGGASAL
jgi:hypothetical protein